MTQDDRKYEIVLWGATGFTGRLAAEHLAERYDENELDWAIAGRNPEKLETVRDDLTEINSDWASLDMLTGDAHDRRRLDAIAEQTKVVCTTVGPYAKYGSNMVEACIEHGTDYCDLAGEPHWMQRMIDEHHENARERGVRIVHACGFDSIPSDLGTLLVQQYAEETFGTPCSSVRAFASISPFNLSGGTMASMVEAYEAISENPEVRRVIENPYALAPKGERDGPGGGKRRGPRYDRDVGQWTAPFIMAEINEKIVHRSNALLNYPWGRNFQYSEATPTGSGLPGVVVAAAISGGLALFTGIMSVSALRKPVDRFLLRNPGQGPSRRTIEGDSFEVRLLGTGTSSGSERGFAAEGRATGNRDPGYGATAWMLAESAVCLARGETDTPLEGGILTPTSGIGTPLIDRLGDVGMMFTAGKNAATGK